MLVPLGVASPTTTPRAIGSMEPSEHPQKLAQKADRTPVSGGM